MSDGFLSTHPAHCPAQVSSRGACGGAELRGHLMGGPRRAWDRAGARRTWDRAGARRAWDRRCDGDMRWS